MASKLDPFLNLLGTVPDERIAEMAGLKPATVTAKRQELKIAAFGGAPEAPVPEPEPFTKAPAPPEPAPEAPKASEPQGEAPAQPEAPPKPVPAETPTPALPTVVELLEAAKVPFRGPKGRTVWTTIPRSLYRGVMAAKVVAWVDAGVIPKRNVRIR